MNDSIAWGVVGIMVGVVLVVAVNVATVMLRAVG